MYFIAHDTFKPEQVPIKMAWIPKLAWIALTEKGSCDNSGIFLYICMEYISLLVLENISVGIDLWLAKCTKFYLGPPGIPKI